MALSIRWCLRAKNGLELVEPNENISSSYPDKGVLDSTINQVKKYASDFYANTITALSKLKEADIKSIREELTKQK